METIDDDVQREYKIDDNTIISSASVVRVKISDNIVAVGNLYRVIRTIDKY